MSDKIYATPKSDLLNQPVVTSRIRIYSPTQVACGTIGGPVGLIYFLMSNFETLGQQERKKKTLFIGIAFIAALIVAIPFLPENFSSMPLTIAYIIVARQVAEKYQITKAEILSSERYDFHSNWRVFGIGLLCLAGSVVAILGPLLLLVLTGIWEPA